MGQEGGGRGSRRWLCRGRLYFGDVEISFFIFFVCIAIGSINGMKSINVKWGGKRLYL